MDIGYDTTPYDESAFYFPDGNASVARLLVRKLVPTVAPGNTMDDIVTAKFDYSQLDQPENLARIRLSSTAVRLQHQAGNLDGDVEPILATEKHVVVIGGGDTGSDCIGTSIRQGALSVTQLEIMPEPPEKEDKGLSWPHWPLKMRTSSSQAEGAERDFSVTTNSMGGAEGCVTHINCQRVDEKFQPVDGSEFELKADLVLLAMGFVHPLAEGMLEELGVELDSRGNIKADTVAYATSREKVFTAGDMRRGQSLVVWAIREGRQAAHAVDKYLMGTTELPR